MREKSWNKNIQIHFADLGSTVLFGQSAGILPTASPAYIEQKQLLGSPVTVPSDGTQTIKRTTGTWSFVHLHKMLYRFLPDRHFHPTMLNGIHAKIPSSFDVVVAGNHLLCDLPLFV